MDIELRNDRIPRNPFDRQFLDMSHSFFLTVIKHTKSKYSIPVSAGVSFDVMCLVTSLLWYCHHVTWGNEQQLFFHDCEQLLDLIWHRMIGPLQGVETGVY